MGETDLENKRYTYSNLIDLSDTMTSDDAELDEHTAQESLSGGADSANVDEEAVSPNKESENADKEPVSAEEESKNADQEPVSADEESVNTDEELENEKSTDTS